jgi:hypothetical protein
VVQNVRFGHSANRCRQRFELEPPDDLGEWVLFRALCCYSCAHRGDF